MTTVNPRSVDPFQPRSDAKPQSISSIRPSAVGNRRHLGEQSHPLPDGYLVEDHRRRHQVEASVVERQPVVNQKQLCPVPKAGPGSVEHGRRDVDANGRATGGGEPGRSWCERRPILGAPAEAPGGGTNLQPAPRVA